MWQRIQTLYFAIAVGLLCALLFGNVGHIIDPEAGSMGVHYLAKLPYAVLIILSFAANLVALFCWGHRSLQIRLAGGSCVLLLALQIWIAIDYFTMDKSFVFAWTAVFPLVCLFLDLMAMRGIYADELLVRSASRLRSGKKHKK